MNNATDIYHIIESPGESLHKVKGSKHYGYALPVTSVAEIQQALATIRKTHYAARHVCYAYRIDPRRPIEKSTDDGEPHNSAGPPILGQIQSADLQNILVAVVRYFGGTKLGVGGLISAYKTAAQLAIADATIAQAFFTQTIAIYFKYDDMNTIMRLTKRPEIKIIAQNFETLCELKILVRESIFTEFCEKLDKLHTINYKIISHEK